MNIVYMLIHKQRLEDNNPPYYYIGSKLKWKGEGTYYSSSREAFMKGAYPEDLIFTPVWSSADCTHLELLNKEKEFQIAHDVLKNPLFFNRNIANSSMYSEVDVDARIAKWKIKASAINKDGIKNSEAWSKKAVAARLASSTPEQRSAAQRAVMYRVTDTGETLKDLVWKKMMATCSAVGEDGLTSFQRGGLKVKETLAEVTPSGLTKAQMRVYYGTRNSKLELFGITFFSLAQAMTFFDCDKGLIYRLQEGWCSTITYARLESLLGIDYMSQFNLKMVNPGCGKPVIVCGKEFMDNSALGKELGITSWCLSRFSLHGQINKKMKAALMSYFGIDTYNTYYPD